MGTDLSRLDARQFEIFQGFLRKGSLKHSESIQYLFRPAKQYQKSILVL